MQVSGALVAGAGCTLQQCDDAAAEVSQPAFQSLHSSRDQSVSGQGEPQHCVSEVAQWQRMVGGAHRHPCIACTALHPAVTLKLQFVTQACRASTPQRQSLSRVQRLSPALHRQAASCPWTWAPERSATSAATSPAMQVLPSCSWITTWRSQSCLVNSLRVPSAGCSCPAALAGMQKDQQHLQSREKAAKESRHPSRTASSPARPQSAPCTSVACLSRAAHSACQGRCQHVVRTLPLLRCMWLASGMALCTAQSWAWFVKCLSPDHPRRFAGCNLSYSTSLGRFSSSPICHDTAGNTCVQVAAPSWACIYDQASLSLDHPRALCRLISGSQPLV